MFSFATSLLLCASVHSPAQSVEKTIPRKSEAARTSAAQSKPVRGVVWDARAVEHLLNRAGFGARAADIEEGLRLGQEALVDKLLTQRAHPDPFFLERVEEPRPRELKEMSDEDQQKIKRETREKDRRQLLEYMGWWFDRMQGGEDPLLERMTLFWSGFFTSSIEEVKRSYELLQQNQFLRANALGSYATLLNGIVRDPAMLIYLDNNVNRKGNPNENLARELMELFSLGQGNYSETDIKEAARALTGRGSNREGAYEYRPKLHDGGEKTVLGTKGKIDGDQLVAILLDQEACPRWVARKLLTYFEGLEPEKKRLEEYAKFLKKSQYEIQPFLRRLFLDPAFYRDEIVGARVQGPVEYMVGIARRLQFHAPPVILASGSALLGQRLFSPPSVKGWDEGYAWITTSALMQRGNLSGLLLGVVKLDDVLNQADVEAAMAADAASDSTDGNPADNDGRRMDGEPMQPEKPAKAAKKASAKGGKANGFAYQALRRIEQSGWSPAINFSARLQRANAMTDAEIVDRLCDDLLAIQAPDDTKLKLRTFLAGERASLGVRDGSMFDAGAEAERVLRRLAHLILSLPEAQLG